MINVWQDSVWLPQNVTWNDLKNGPNKTVVYAVSNDLWIQVPLVAVILILKILFIKLLFTPLGIYLKIYNRRKTIQKNKFLEDCYQKSLKNTRSIAKKLEMSESQVERWLLIRRSQDNPKLVKFNECMWKGSFYLFNDIIAINVLWDKDWVWNVDLCFEGYPHQGVTGDIKWYYMICTAFYWSLLVCQFWDMKRKDFWQMFLHHIATVILLTFSWISNLHRIGSLVLLLHDSSDVFLEFGKAAKYAKLDNWVLNAMFVMFFSVWSSMRLFVFPRYILTRVYHRLIYFPMFFIMFLLLCFLMILNIYWTWLIMHMAYKAVKAGEFEEDIRSSSETED